LARERKKRDLKEARKIKYKLFPRQQLLLLAMVIFSCATLISLNTFISKTTSGLRAYINAESLYSKGQKDAVRHLTLFLISNDDHHFEQFKAKISVPLGDSIARVHLQSEGNLDTIRAGFLQAGNHPEDVEHLIWLFQNFEDVSFMEKAIQIWEEADALVAELNALGHALHQSKKADRIEPDAMKLSFERLNLITKALTFKEQEFSEHISQTGRKISKLLLGLNIFFILLILSSTGLMAWYMLGNMQRSRKSLAIKNLELHEMNRRLDHFIYASSHDLKAPINNIDGLIALMRDDLKEPNQSMLLDKMSYSLGSLKYTIRGIEELMRTDKLGQNGEEQIQFEALLLRIIEENKLLFDKEKVQVETDFKITEIMYSPVAIKSILQNLLTNAVKYRAHNQDQYLQGQQQHSIGG
jgi:signal transduction histidine kinase